MKNPTTVLVIALLAVVAALLWRLERHSATLAELARVQIEDRAEARRAELERIAAAERARVEAHTQAAEAAAKQAAETAAAELRAREEAARLALLSSPVQAGEVVPEIQLDNRQVVRDATVVAVQATSVSFKVGTRLYNIPTEQLPADLRTRIRRMFPQTEPVTEPVSQP